MMAYIYGTNLGESLLGTIGNDFIFGYGGNDELYGGEGDDTIDAGEGFDEVYAGNGNDIVIGGAGYDYDYLRGEGGYDTLYLSYFPFGITITIWTASPYSIAKSGSKVNYFNGFEKIVASNLDDIFNSQKPSSELLMGEGGNDEYFFSSGFGHDTIYDTSGSADFIHLNFANITIQDVALSREGNDLILSIINSSNDKITVQDHFNTSGHNLIETLEIFSEPDFDLSTLNLNDGQKLIIGTSENDTFIATENAESFYGHEGIDTVSFMNSTTGVAVNMSTDTHQFGYAESDNMNSIENITGSGYNDILIGNKNDNELSGSLGVDRLTGNAGDDYLYGEAGNDTLIGGEGIDHLYGGEGDDNLNGGAGGDLIDGGNGSNDHVWYDNSNNAITIDLNTNTFSGGYAEGDSVSNIEIFIGSNYNDALTAGSYSITFRGWGGDDRLEGSISNNYLFGDNGNDVLLGFEGVDYLYGGEGNDNLNGGAGGDLIDGGNGANDHLWYTDSNTAVMINLSATNNQFSGGHATGDSVSNIEVFVGSNHNDTLTGDDNANIFHGWLGNDIINGKGGNDLLYGKEGHDIIAGGEGNDVLYGGNDNDDLYAHLGSDIMYGQQGDDIFYFTDEAYSLETNTFDVIADFQQGADKINLSSLGYTSISNLDISVINGETVIRSDDINEHFAFKMFGSYSLTSDDFIFS